MSTFIEDLQGALKTVVGAAWPDVLGDGITSGRGIREAEALEQIPWAELSPPYAAILLGDMVGADWAADSQCFEVLVEVYYVGAVTGKSTALRAKLQALFDALFAAPLTSGQLLEVTEMTYRSTLPPNMIFAEKGYTHRACRLTAKVLVGEKP